MNTRLMITFLATKSCGLLVYDCVCIGICHNVEDYNLNPHYHENLKSCTFYAKLGVLD